MRFDKPLDLEALLLHEADDLIGRLISDAAGGVVDVHHAVDDGASVGIGILDDIADRIGRLVEECRDLGLDAEIDRLRDIGGHGVPPVDSAVAVLAPPTSRRVNARATAIPASIAATKTKVETEPADSAATAGPGQ